MNILRLIRYFIYFIFMLPQIVVFVICKYKLTFRGVILQDLHRWKEIKNINSNDLLAFVYLFIKQKELRSVFYWRLGKLAPYIFFWLPGRSDLHLFTSPKNVDGGFYVGHGWGTVVNAKRIGRNFRVGQNVTVGSRNIKEPVIGDNVSVWANAIVLGNITIGDNTQIGAGSVVVKNVPANCIVVPSKSTIIKKDGIRVNIPL